MVTANSENSMLSLFSLLIIFVAVITAALNKSYHRAKCAAAILIPSFVHFAFMNDVNGASYYHLAMVFNMITIGLLELIKRKTPTHLLTDLQLISFGTMCVNLVGFLIWYSYLPPTVYNALWLVMASVEALRLFIHTKGDKVDGIDSGANNWRDDANERRLGSGG